jgi:hypothetical protein
VEPIRERIEVFIRRYGVFRVLVVAVLPAVIGAILGVMVWLSLGPSGTQTSVDRNDVVWACGRKVLAEYRGIPRELREDIARGMRKDCGIFGPQAAGTSGDRRPYAPKCVEGEFCELRRYGVLRSSLPSDLRTTKGIISRTSPILYARRLTLFGTPTTYLQGVLL